MSTWTDRGVIGFISGLAITLGFGADFGLASVLGLLCAAWLMLTSPAQNNKPAPPLVAPTRPDCP